MHRTLTLDGILDSATHGEVYRPIKYSDISLGSNTKSKHDLQAGAVNFDVLLHFDIIWRAG